VEFPVKGVRSCVGRGAIAVALAVVASLAGVVAGGAPDAPGPAGPGGRILVFDEQGQTRPAFVQFMEGFRAGYAEGGGQREVFVENLDMARLGRVGGDADTAAAWLVEKYRDRPFDVLVPTTVVTRDIVVADRDRLAPRGRIIAVERVSEEPDRSDRPGDPHDGAVRILPTEADTVALVRRLLPLTSRVVFIGETAHHATFTSSQMARVRDAVLAAGLEYEPILDLPVEELLVRLRDEPAGTAVIYAGYWRGERGRASFPAEVLRSLAAASNLPFFGMLDTYVGRGAVGGVCFDTHAIGVAAGRLAAATPDGAPFASIDVAPVCRVDGHLLARFGIPDSRLPPDCVVINREPTLWSRYRWQILAGAALVAVETALIAALLAQSRLRRRAERLVSEQRDQITHAGRVSMLGQFAASLAHELGQPLGAILNNVEAATLLLRDDRSENAAELRAILADIAADDARAGVVLDRIRFMVRRQRFSPGPVDVPALLRAVLSLAGPRLGAERVEVGVTCDPELPLVAGDEVLLQQALLNLVGNSADAIRATAGGRQQPGAISIRARRERDSVELAVIDNGGGIADPMLEQVLEPFQSTKSDGLGMGLPIVRAIAEQHDGTLRLENEPGRGLTVSLRVPVWRE